MIQISIQVDGMMCGMCEAHINDEIRKNFQVKRVSSSHIKGKTTILTEKDISDADLRTVITKTGYKMISANHAVYEKKSLWDKILRKK